MSSTQARATRLWDQPVVVVQWNKSTLVKSPLEAFRILYDGWPYPKTAKYRKAIQKCASARAEADAELARSAFVEAMEDAGIVVN